MQADLGVDEDLLSGRQAVDLELGVDGDVALDHRQRDRAELVVARRGTDEADRLLAEQYGTTAGGRLSEPSRCSRVSRRGGRPSVCTRATVSWPR